MYRQYIHMKMAECMPDNRFMPGITHFITELFPDPALHIGLRCTFRETPKTTPDPAGGPLFEQDFILSVLDNNKNGIPYR
jgi:hypothetical protein